MAARSGWSRTKSRLISRDYRISQRIYCAGEARRGRGAMRATLFLYRNVNPWALPYQCRLRQGGFPVRSVPKPSSGAPRFGEHNESILRDYMVERAQHL
jgi:hypothetical protein